MPCFLVEVARLLIVASCCTANQEIFRVKIICTKIFVLKSFEVIDGFVIPNTFYYS